MFSVSFSHLFPTMYVSYYYKMPNDIKNVELYSHLHFEMAWKLSITIDSLHYLQKYTLGL